MSTTPGTEDASGQSLPRRRATTRRLLDRLCAVTAAANGTDPIGYAAPVSRFMAIETPMPWGPGLDRRDPGGTIDERINDVRGRWAAQVERRSAAGAPQWGSEGMPGVYGIAPDVEWSAPGVRRVLLASRPFGPFATYDMAEYAFPSESALLVEMVEAFLASPSRLADFDDHRVAHAGQRELFVCTHGYVDICCARFGLPLYRQLRAAHQHVRAWRTTHFGGHQFAPTAWEFPSGYMWAFLDERAAAQLIARDGEAQELAARIRGWSGASSLVQVVDRVGFLQHGWRWLEFERSGEVVGHDPAIRRWDVRLTYRSPDGTEGTYEGVLVVGRDHLNVGCGPQWGTVDHRLPEYRLDSLQHVTSAPTAPDQR